MPVSERPVAVLMSWGGIAGLPGPAKVKRLSGIATTDELVHREFHRLWPGGLRVTDLPEHPSLADSRTDSRAATCPSVRATQEGKGYCRAVMDTSFRRIVGWSIDTAQDSNLVVNALDMAIKNRNPHAGTIVHADHGVHSTSWVFTSKIRAAG